MNKEIEKNKKQMEKKVGKLRKRKKIKERKNEH